jgi:hypothetical protein
MTPATRKTIGDDPEGNPPLSNFLNIFQPWDDTCNILKQNRDKPCRGGQLPRGPDSLEGSPQTFLLADPIDVNIYPNIYL